MALMVSHSESGSSVVSETAVALPLTPRALAVTTSSSSPAGAASPAGSAATATPSSATTTTRRPRGRAMRRARDVLFRSQFRKTELCTFFESGGCEKGLACRFAHGVEQLQQAPDLKKTSICKLWEEGRCPHADQPELCCRAHGELELRSTGAFATRCLDRNSETASTADPDTASSPGAMSCSWSEFEFSDQDASVAHQVDRRFWWSGQSIPEQEATMQWPVDCSPMFAQVPLDASPCFPAMSSHQWPDAFQQGCIDGFQLQQQHVYQVAEMQSGSPFSPLEHASTLMQQAFQPTPSPLREEQQEQGWQQQQESQQQQQQVEAAAVPTSLPAPEQQEQQLRQSEEEVDEEERKEPVSPQRVGLPLTAGPQFFQTMPWYPMEPADLEMLLRQAEPECYFD